MRQALTILFVTLLGVACKAEDRPHYGGCELVGRLRDAAQTSFAFRIQSSPNTTKHAVTVHKWWGRDGGIPDRFIAGLSFTLGIRQVIIPSRAFADLGDPNIPEGISVMQ